MRNRRQAIVRQVRAVVSQGLAQRLQARHLLLRGVLGGNAGRVRQPRGQECFGEPVASLAKRLDGPGRRQPEPHRQRRHGAAADPTRDSASASAAAFATWSIRRAFASSVRLTMSSRASAVAAWRRRAASSSCMVRAKLRLTNFKVEAQCTPSRSAIIAGRRVGAELWRRLRASGFAGSLRVVG